MAKIVLTGGAGFIGTELVKELIKQNYDVYVFDKVRGTLPYVKYYPVDITNNEQLENILKEINPDCIIHLAAALKGTYEELYTVNVLGTKNIVNAFKGRIIFLSSGMVYQGCKAPFSEEMDVNPKDDYPKTKRIAEELCLQNNNSAVMRASVVYGPEQRGSMFIPDLKEHIRTKNFPFKMTKGEQTRDFIHVTDLVHAVMRLLEGNQIGIFNIAFGESKSLINVVNLAKEIVGDFAVEHSVPYRNNEMMEYSFDTTRARTVLNWQPKTDVRTGLAETLTKN